MTEQTFTNRHGDELLLVHHEDSAVPGSVELRLDEDAIHLEPDVALRLALAIAPATVVGPDDRLVVRLDTSVTLEDMDEFQESLRSWAPGLAGRIVVLGGAVDAFVVRPGDEVPS